MRGLSTFQHVVRLEELARRLMTPDCGYLQIQTLSSCRSDIAQLGWQSSGITPDDYHFELFAQLLASPLCATLRSRQR